MGYSVVLFDLDGTLTDSSDGIIKSLQYSAVSMGRPEPDYKSLIPYVGPPISIVMEEYFHYPPLEQKQAIAFYRERYHAVGMYENKIYDGVLPLLHLLKQQHKTLAIATSKPEVFALKIADHFHFTEYFQCICGGSLDSKQNTKERIIKNVLNTLQVHDLPSIVMIGDRKYDIEGAKRNGIASLGVLFGYGSSEELAQAGADYLVETPLDILKYV